MAFNNFPRKPKEQAIPSHFVNSKVLSASSSIVIEVKSNQHHFIFLNILFDIEAPS